MEYLQALYDLKLEFFLLTLPAWFLCAGIWYTEQR